jgi:hypothetical protein
MVAGLRSERKAQEECWRRRSGEREAQRSHRERPCPRLISRHLRIDMLPMPHQTFRDPQGNFFGSLLFKTRLALYPRPPRHHSDFSPAMRGSSGVATIPCLSSPWTLPSLSRKKERRPFWPYFSGVAASSNLVSLPLLSGLIRYR